MYLYGTNHHRYCECLPAVFIFGWMHTVTYVKMFKQWHAFAMTFKRIVAKDVTRFAYIFVFVLISFSLAIHALSMSLYPPVDMHARTLAETIYLTFCLTVTVTVGGLLDISTEPDYEHAGGNIHLLHIVFAGYLCISTIILLNMLIAMMNTTYSEVSLERATAWRIESLRTALWVERTIPICKHSVFIRLPTHSAKVGDRQHWFIKYTPDQTSDVETRQVDRQLENASSSVEFASRMSAIETEQKAIRDQIECQTNAILAQLAKLQETLEKKMP
jgi:hypothetical protein